MFKIVWDRPHNGVILTMSSAGEALGIAPRPVFYEELDLLGLNHMGWVYPHSVAPLLWACDRRYFYCGVLVMEVKGGNIFDAPEIYITPEGKNIVLTPIDVDYLRDANADTMFLIEHEAMEFINGVYRRYKGITKASETNPDIDFQALAARIEKKTGEKQVVVKESCDSFDGMSEAEANAQGKGAVLTSKIDMFVASFSGGKDSQVLLDLVTRVIPSTDFYVLYSDTGYELPTSLSLYRDIASYYHKQYPDLKFEEAKNNKPVLYYWDKMGSPSNVMRWCCGVMKTAPLYIKLKELSGLGKQPHVLSFIGTRAEESTRRASYLRVANDAKHANVINVSPILDWNTTEIWLYLISHALPFNNAYRSGLGRVGCVICPFGSDWNDYLCNKLYPETTRPFIDKIREFAVKDGKHDIDNYIKTGNWKIRAGGKGYETKSTITIISQSPDFKAFITNPSENIFEWLKVLGHSKVSQSGNVYTVSVKYSKERIFSITLEFNSNKDSIVVTVPNVEGEITFISHLKRVLNKATYCVNCELCEVECPTGALRVTPIVKINSDKCIRCRKCLDFKDNGCITATSIKQSEGMKTNTTSKATINRYNNFGMRERWVEYYFEHYETYFDNFDHGLNKDNQLKPFTNWLIDSGILNVDTTISESGKLLAAKYAVQPNLVWEIMWVNLTNDSGICKWYIQDANFNRVYTLDELRIMLENSLPEYSVSVRKNALGSLCNTFSSCPIGSALGVAQIRKEKGKPLYTRIPNNDIALVTVAYSLYRYAESKDRYSLTVSEFYNGNQDQGIYRQFGIDRQTFERCLRSLQEERNHILNVQLNLGLDNINLRDDLKSTDILKMML